MAIRWNGPLFAYGKLTRDRRTFDKGEIGAASTPMALRYQPVFKPAHADSVDVGSIDQIDLSSNPVMASGRFLPASVEPLVVPAIEKAKMGINMPSVDLAPYFKARIGEDADGKYLAYMKAQIIAATLVSIAAYDDQRFNISDDFQNLTASAWTFEEIPDSEGLTAAVNASGWEGLPIAHRDAAFKADDAIKRIAAWAGIGTDSFDAAKMKRAYLWMDPNIPANDYTAYRLPIGDILDGKLTIIYHAVYAGAALINGAHGGLPNVPAAEKARLVPIINNIYKAMGEAFGQTLNPPWNQGATTRALAMGDEEFSHVEGDRLVNGLVAGSGPLAPPADWFTDPKLTGPTRIKIDDDGRVYGHLGQLGVCHTGYSNVCITLPDSKTNYARFHQGDVICANGERIAVGKITLGTGHAGSSLAMRAAVEHYDNTGTVVAVVRAGRDSHGDWVAGSLVAGLDPARVAELRRSPLSGDWRHCQETGGLELIAALAVNSPGFPVTEVVDGVQVSMVAAGMIGEEGWVAPTFSQVTDGVTEVFPEATDGLDLGDVVRQAADEVQARERRTERLAAVIAADQMGRVERLAKLTGE